MLTLALLQAATTPEWVGPTVAISLAVLALSFLAMALVVGVLALRVAGQVRRLTPLVEGLQEDLSRTLQTARRLTEQGQDLLVLIRHEAGAFAETSRRVRRKVMKGVDRVELRLQDLETLYEIMQEEIEDTALDVAAALRSARRGNGMLGRVRRLLVPGAR